LIRLELLNEGWRALPMNDGENFTSVNVEVKYTLIIGFFCTLVHLGAELCHFDISVQFSLHYYAIFMHATVAYRMCTKNAACACIKMA
jgi:hypothetical protein